MSGKLRIHDWDTWQTYRKDRGQPPWIKVHRQILRDQKWISLSDSERGQLMAIWVLAAERNGEIPDNEGLVQKMCFMCSQPNFNKLIELGFLDAAPGRRRDDANVTPDGSHGDAPEKRRVEKNNAHEHAQMLTQHEQEKNLDKAQMLFDEFWSHYPNKVGKKRATKAFANLPRKDQLAALSDIKSGRFANADKKFVPHPTTYLHGERWNDESAVIEEFDSWAHNL